MVVLEVLNLFRDLVKYIIIRNFIELRIAREKMNYLNDSLKSQK
jgi:hypothetical protein